MDVDYKISPLLIGWDRAFLGSAAVMWVHFSATC